MTFSQSRCFAFNSKPVKCCDLSAKAFFFFDFINVHFGEATGKL